MKRNMRIYHLMWFSLCNITKTDHFQGLYWCISSFRCDFNRQFSPFQILVSVKKRCFFGYFIKVTTDNHILMSCIVRECLSHKHCAETHKKYKTFMGFAWVLVSPTPNILEVKVLIFSIENVWYLLLCVDYLFPMVLRCEYLVCLITDTID